MFLKSGFQVPGRLSNVALTASARNLVDDIRLEASRQFVLDPGEHRSE